MYSLALIIFVVSEKAYEHFPIGSNVNLHVLMYCGGGHLEFLISKKTIKFVKDLPMIIPGQFGFNVQVVSEKKRFETFFP